MRKFPEEIHVISKTRKFLKIRASLLLLSIATLTLVGPNHAQADCTERACIDVYVEDGQIVIEGKKLGSSAKPGATKSVKPPAKKPINKPTNKPSNKPTVKPLTPKPKPIQQKPVQTKPAKPKPIKPKPTKRPKPSGSPSKVTDSLADKILQSLPTLQVAYQPEGAALVRVPVIFFTDLPTFFNKDFKILGETVRINVKPRSLWNFGDGNTLLTSKPGKPYPDAEITHSYSVPGTYLVSVSTIWQGSFTIGDVTKEIPGTIRQLSAVEVKVVGASTRFVGK